MLRLIFWIVFGVVGCGRQPDPPTPSGGGGAQDTRSGLAVEADLILEDIAVLGPRDPGRPEYCFKLGHAAGKAAVLGFQVEVASQEWKIKPERYRALIFPAQKLQSLHTRPGEGFRCADTDVAQIGTLVSQVRDVLREDEN